MTRKLTAAKDRPKRPNVRVLFIAPLCDPEILWIDGDDYTQVRALVGGTLDGRAMGNGLSLYCNDEGIMRGLPPNFRTTGGDLYVGNVVVSRYNEPGDTVDLTDDDVTLVRRWVAGSYRLARFFYSEPEFIAASGPNLENARAEVAVKAALRPPIVVTRVEIVDPFARENGGAE